MSGVEACIGIGVQNAGWRNPPVQDWGKTFPPHLCALTPADQNTLPEPAHAKFEDAQLGRVPGNSVVLVITQHDLPEPRTDFGYAIVHPALKLNLDGFEFRNHSLLRSDPPYGEGSALVALPTVVGKAQEGEGLWFSLSPLLPVASGEPPELDQSSLLCIEFQAELGQTFPKCFQESLRVGSAFEAHHKIVGITNNNDIAVCHFLAPGLYP
jgi:hypothetical protein